MSVSAHLAKKIIFWMWLHGNTEYTYRFYIRPVFGTTMIPL